MTRDYTSLLDLLLQDLDQAESFFKPTHYWQTCSQRLIEDLSANGLDQFRAQPAPLTHFVPTYTFNALAGQRERLAEIGSDLRTAMPEHPKMQAALDRFLEGAEQAEADYRVYRSNDREAAPYLAAVNESTVGAPVGQFEFDARRYSRSMLNYLLGLCFVKSCVGEFSVRTVLEIGGGFGTLGEILLSDTRNETCYIDIDIPPTSIYSTYYLSEVLGSDRVFDYLQATEALADSQELDINGIRETCDAAVLPPWLLPKLRGTIDLFVNFISFQEMEPDIVEHYLSEVARLEPTYVLLRNLSEGKEIAQTEGQLGVLEPTRAADYDEFLPQYEIVATDASVFGYRTVDGFHSELRLYRQRR